MGRFIDNDPRAPWNGVDRDNPFAPWNNGHQNDPFAP